MLGVIGIRRETKDETQRRSPLSPRHVRELVRKEGLRVIVQPWEHRIFRDDDYRKAGAIISDDLSQANIVYGVKEVAPPFLEEGQTYCFFSHTAKGQTYNMPMLRAMRIGGTHCWTTNSPGMPAGNALSASANSPVLRA